MKLTKLSFAERQPRGGRRIGSTRSAGPRGGFTLVELLVVIAIILTCAGLMVPVVSKIREKADRTKCASNLKQIGTAIFLYAGENDGALPGPTWGGQMAECPKSYGVNGTPELMYFLAPYLGPYGPPVPPYVVIANEWYSPIFECPAARRVLLAQNNGSLNLPYFYLASSPFTTIPPTRIVNLVAKQATVALMDLDQKTPYGVGSATVAAAPVHGFCRNTLYFDGHVQAVPVAP